MNNDDHLLTLKIDAYIKGQLSDVERQAFENDLQTDATLANRVRTQRAELVMLEIMAEETLRLKVRKWSSQMDDDKPSRQWWRHPLSIFAFLSGIVALFFLLFSKKTVTDEAIQMSPTMENKDTTPNPEGS